MPNVWELAALVLWYHLARWLVRVVVLTVMLLLIGLIQRRKRAGSSKAKGSAANG